jgi:plastocyanin
MRRRRLPVVVVLEQRSGIRRRMQRQASVAAPKLARRPRRPPNHLKPGYVTAALVAVVAAAATVATAAPASAGGGCHRPPTESRGTTLALTELCFSPTVLRVEPGAAVTVVNRDTIAHPLSRPGGDWYWDGEGDTRTTVRMDQPGTYPFFCFAHPGMVGVVVVGDGQGTGAGISQVSATGAAAPQAEAAAGERPVAALPAAWMVLVALAALVGAAVGTRLRGKGSA